jgi:hypothetical protein
LRGEETAKEKFVEEKKYNGQMTACASALKRRKKVAAPKKQVPPPAGALRPDPPEVLFDPEPQDDNAFGPNDARRLELFLNEAVRRGSLIVFDELPTDCVKSGLDDLDNLEFLDERAKLALGGKPDPDFDSLLKSSSKSVAIKQSDEHEVSADQNVVLRADGNLLKSGVVYRSIGEASEETGAPRTTLLRWAHTAAVVGGRPIEYFYFVPTRSYFLSEPSIERVANRFVTWPKKEPAGRVEIGKSKDGSGFITLADAAEIAGVSKRTMWLWARQGTAPSDRPLDIICCTASDYFYIRERDAFNLKKLVPRSGLPRGRRPLAALHK